jgi:hypothetical protein
MFVAPPSRRSDGVYKWLNNLPIADAPEWLIALVCDTEVRSDDDDDSNETLSDAEITAGCIAIRDQLPNPDLGWDEWNTIGMKIWFTVSDARGHEAFDGVSKRSIKYNERNTLKRWNAFFKSPPTNITTGSFIYLVNEAIGVGWRDTVKEPQEEEAEPERRSLDDVHAAFRKWLGADYDLSAIDATCAAAASERLDGDPLWLLLISGPGAAKTETVQAVSGAPGAHVISTIASEGALLSASPKRSRVKQATGGLLRKIGDHGVLIIKDVTSILSAARETRGCVLAAIREIYDGHWVRNVGTDGGQTLEWVGRIVIIGAVTTAWDSAHAVVAAMGDRFVLIRIDSNVGRIRSGAQAISNTGSEVEMREELAEVVGGLIAHASTDVAPLTEDESTRLLKAADITTMARTACERDFKGDAIYAHAPEMPTRFAKQLTQLVRGGVAIGMQRDQAMLLAIRCARDSIPPMRLEILLDLAAHPDSTPNEVRERTAKPWTSTRRELDALTMLGMVTCIEDVEDTDQQDDKRHQPKRTWTYSLHDNFDRRTLLTMAGKEPTERFDRFGSVVAMNRSALRSVEEFRKGAHTNGKGAMWVHDL